MKVSVAQTIEGHRVPWLVTAFVVVFIASSVVGINVAADPRIKAPWVASIFYKNPSNGLWEYICGGTITSASTVITSARCLLPRVTGEKFSSRPFHYNYENLAVAAGLKTNKLEEKDKFTQIGKVGQIRDLFAFMNNPDTPYKDVAGIRLQSRFNLSTPYVKQVILTQQGQTILEANATKPGDTVIIAGFERLDNSGVKTRSQSSQTLQIREIVLTDVTTCIDRYTSSYDAFYFDLVCGKPKDTKDSFPCRYQGTGMVAKARFDAISDPNFYLFGVYSSNTALAKSEGNIKSKNAVDPGDCTSNDIIFFTKFGYLDNWGISHEFCGDDLAQCLDNRCRPWTDLCDGTAQCDDKSDETPQMCHNQKKCKPQEFRCNYGACIDKSKTCNGIQDCTVDGSDEDSDGVCKSKIRNSTTTTTPVVAGCPAIPQKKGIDVRCNHPDRKDTFSCATFPVPVGTSAVIKQTEIKASCKVNGMWSQSVQVKC